MVLDMKYLMGELDCGNFSFSLLLPLAFVRFLGDLGFLHLIMLGVRYIKDHGHRGTNVAFVITGAFASFSFFFGILLGDSLLLERERNVAVL
jgi:hypothetical protein